MITPTLFSATASSSSFTTKYIAYNDNKIKVFGDLKSVCDKKIKKKKSIRRQQNNNKKNDIFTAVLCCRAEVTTKYLKT